MHKRNIPFHPKVRSNANSEMLFEVFQQLSLIYHHLAAICQITNPLSRGPEFSGSHETPAYLSRRAHHIRAQQMLSAEHQVPERPADNAILTAFYPLINVLNRTFSNHLFNFANCLPWVQTFRTSICTVHNRMTTIKLKWVFKIIQTFTCRLITTIS